MVNSVESGENLDLQFQMKFRLKQLFVTPSNCDKTNKLEKPIKNSLDLFINTRLNHMSTRSSLLSQPKNKSILNSEQLFNVTD